MGSIENVKNYLFSCLVEVFGMPRIVKQENTIRTIRQIVLDITENIRPEEFIEYKPILGSEIFINPIYPNIDIYYLKLKQLSNIIK